MLKLLKCSKCKKKQQLIVTGLKSSNGCFIYKTKDGRQQIGNVCLKCKNLKRRICWNTDSKIKSQIAAYEKTPKGYLVRKYRNMLSRVKGIQKKKAHLYADLCILSKEEFYQWAIHHPEFKLMFARYIANNHDRKLAPTVDRIDSTKGYVLSNMQWLTHSENSSKGAKNRKVLRASSVS